MILGELLGLADLSGAKILCIYKATKVVIICEDKHLILATLKIVTLYLENFNNS